MQKLTIALPFVYIDSDVYHPSVCFLNQRPRITERDHADEMVCVGDY